MRLGGERDEDEENATAGIGGGDSWPHPALSGLFLTPSRPEIP
jgi:hypothetical protein